MAGKAANGVSEKGDLSKGWQNVGNWLIAYRRRTPALLFSKVGAGPYLFTMTLVLNACALAASYIDSSLFRIFVSLFAFAYIVDSLLFNTSVVFFGGSPRHTFRTVIFTVWAFWNVVACFSIFYVAIGRCFNPILSYPRALFFSIATATTLGDGGITLRAWPAFFMVASQLFSWSVFSRCDPSSDRFMG